MNSVTNTVRSGGKAVGSLLDDFKAFINRGNVVDLAVGVVMGAAFTAIVNSLVKDLFTPIIGLVFESQLEQAFHVLKCGFEGNSTTIRLDSCDSTTYSTIEKANASGAVTWNYGSFLQAVINFLLVSLIVFSLLKLYTAAFVRPKVEEAKDTTECPYCYGEVKKKASKCPHCTSPIYLEP